MARRHQDMSYWISYSDLSTGLLLVFILLVAHYINRSAKESELLRQEQAQVRVKKAELVQVQSQVKVVQNQIGDLLAGRDLMGERLEAASRLTNEQLGRQVFIYDPENQEVVVSTSNESVAWFRQGSSKLTPNAREEVVTFYIHLYEQMMCTDGLGSENPCEAGEPSVPEFLDSIEILGHSDPTGRGVGQAPWSWQSYNGGATSGYGVDSNLELAQARAKSIVNAIEEVYLRGDKINDNTHPWRPFMALVHTSGRAWMSSYCQGSSGPVELEAGDFFTNPPCVYDGVEQQIDLASRSRRVSFGFRLDDQQILRQLQMLTIEVARKGQP